jgi:Rad3-related DNA helicase
LKEVQKSHDYILAAVCNGKLSEGVNFGDNMARAIIIVGVPFPNISDEKLKIRREYYIPVDLEKEWLLNEAMRTVNQAIGRIIRHSDDFGAIYLVDERYNEYRIQ